MSDIWRNIVLVQSENIVAQHVAKCMAGFTVDNSRKSIVQEKSFLDQTTKYKRRCREQNSGNITERVPFVPPPDPEANPKLSLHLSHHESGGEGNKRNSCLFHFWFSLIIPEQRSLYSLHHSLQDVLRTAFWEAQLPRILSNNGSPHRFQLNVTTVSQESSVGHPRPK